MLVGFWWLVLRTPESAPSTTIAAENADEQSVQAQPSNTASSLMPVTSRNNSPSARTPIPEPTRAPVMTPQNNPNSAQASRPISVITMGERTDSGASVGESISGAIDRAKGRQQTASSDSRPPAGNATNAAPAIASMISRAETAALQNRLVESRTLYNAALLDPRSDASTQAMLRKRITSLNNTLLFGPTINANDPFAGRYEIAPGDALSKLPRKLDLSVNWRFLQRINGISDPKRIRVGQRIKTVSGPFHAVISKSQYRMDLYMGDSSELMFVASFPVGLGENDSTPVGSWIVRKESKLVNPRWVNPRTGEVFGAENPQNPIGERWIGIEGVDDETVTLQGFGIHGTVDPESIGTQASMGCIRLGDDDVALVYELLIEGVSRVEITP